MSMKRFIWILCFNGVCKYYIGPIGDLSSLLTATAAAGAAARVQFAIALSH